MALGDKTGRDEGIGKAFAPAIRERTPRSVLRRILPKGLLARSLMIIVTPLVLLQVISTWVFFDRHYDATTRRLVEGVAGDLAVIIQVMIHSPTDLDRDELFLLAGRSMRLGLIFEENAVLQERTPSSLSFNIFAPSLDRKLAGALTNIVGRPFLIDNRLHLREVEVQIQLADGVLVAIVPRSRLFSSTTYIFIMWMIGSSIILFGVAGLFMRNQVRPIKRLAAAAESFGKGQDVQHFKPEGATEVRQAAAAFLKMRARIKRQIEQRMEILSGVSHDLRTPLTRMKLQLAMLDDRSAGENLGSDVTEMERMIEGYLAFARGEGLEQPQDCDFAEILRDTVAQLDSEKAPIELDIAEGAVMPLRREAIRRCITNLITNAQRYGHRVRVTCGRRARGLELLVDDDGPGIHPDLREDVFKPFFRLEQSRNPATGGVGLGLTIARDVARNHGGELTLDSAPAGGLRARLWLPF